MSTTNDNQGAELVAQWGEFLHLTAQWSDEAQTAVAQAEESGLDILEVYVEDVDFVDGKRTVTGWLSAADGEQHRFVAVNRDGNIEVKFDG